VYESQLNVVERNGHMMVTVALSELVNLQSRFLISRKRRDTSIDSQTTSF
jgi:hypothetical protein